MFQLFSVIYFDPNTYGSVSAYVIGLILRLGGGEPTFGLNPFVYYPGEANFPYKTFAMIISFATLLIVSYLSKFLFRKGIIPPKYDFLKCNLADDGRDIALKKRRSDLDDNGKTNHAFDKYELKSQL